MTSICLAEIILGTIAGLLIGSWLGAQWALRRVTDLFFEIEAERQARQDGHDNPST